MAGTQQLNLDGFQVVDKWTPRRRTDVRLSLKMAADWRRVIHALSIPEYIETWMQPPDADELLFVFEPGKQQSFRIRLYRIEGLDTSIDGSSQVVDGTQVVYRWKTTSRRRTTETLVSFKLQGSSRGCILRLRHSGFRDRAESRWHSKLWQRSFERLGRLIPTNTL